MERFFKLMILTALVCVKGVIAADCANAVTTFEMKECENARLLKAEKVLNVTYKKLAARLDTTGKEKLAKAQKAWLASRDADSIFFSDYSRGGSMEGLEGLGIKASMTEIRVKELSEELQRR